MGYNWNSIITYFKNVLDSTYVKTNDSRLTDNRTPTSHTHGNLQNDGAVGSSNNESKNVVTDSNGKITVEDKPSIPSASNTTPSADTLNGDVGNGVTWARSNHKHPKSDLYAEASHSHSATDVTDSNSSNYSNIGNLNSNSSQQVINNAINSKLGSLTVDVIEWDTADSNGLPSTTASANTMNKLYLIKNTSEEEISNDTLKFTITGNSVTIPYGTFGYDSDGEVVTVDWGDGTVTNYISENHSEDSDSHTYTDGLTSHEIKINGNITTIYGYGLFIENSNIISVSFSSPITTLDYQCFIGCTNLETVVLSSVTMLYEECFMGCSSLRNIIIPSTVIAMDTGCFEDCTGLESIEFEWDSSNDIIDYRSSWIKGANDDVVFIIPQGTTSLYSAKDYPSEKLVGKTEEDSNLDNDDVDVLTDAYDVFVTQRTGTEGDYTYNWELIDSVSLDVSGKANTSDLSDVAFSGDYDDLTDKPTIPVDVSDLTDTQNTAFTPKTHTHNEYLTKTTADTYYQAIGSSSAITSSDLTDVETVEVVVTYTDNSTETLVLLAQTQTQGNGE